MTVLVIAVSPALAQVSIVSPANGQVLVAGPDFATDVLQDPWDFSNVEDLSQHPDDWLGWDKSGAARSSGPSVFLAGGRFAARSVLDSAVGLHYAGHDGIVNPGRSGLRFPIDTTRYRRIALRAKFGANPVPDTLQVHYFLEAKKAGNRLGTLSLAGTSAQGERVYAGDLPNLGAQPVFGLSVAPTDRANVDVELDWVRLTQADGAAGAAVQNVAFTGCSGNYTVSLVEADGLATAMAAGSATGGPKTVPIYYGIFPPGTYGVRVTCGNGQAQNSVVINAPPQVTVTSPGEQGGSDDYATTVLGNPWDMAQVTDVAWAGGIQSGAVVPGPSGPQLEATDLPVSGDPQLLFLNGNAAVPPISSKHYRYLTYTLEVLTPFDLRTPEGGSNARVFWGTREYLAEDSATGTKDILIWPGRQTYTIDLASLRAPTGIETNCNGCSTDPWEARSARFLRIDPHEFQAAVTFRLDDVRLTAPVETTVGSPVALRWTLADADSAGSTYRLALYRQQDNGPGQPLGAKVLIAANIGTALGPGAYSWTPDAGVPTGTHYVVVEVQELRGGVSTVSSAISGTVVRVLPAGLSLPNVQIDGPAAGGGLYPSSTIHGCAFEANGAGLGVDEVIVTATPGPGVVGGRPQYLGIGGLYGTFGYQPQTGAAVPCPSFQAGSAFANSGFAVTGINSLADGLWTIHTYARSAVTGRLAVASAADVRVRGNGAPARNFRIADGSGNTFTLAWDQPGQGPEITAWRIEASLSPNFTPIAGFAYLPGSQTSVTATLPAAAWYFRLIGSSVYGSEGDASNVVCMVLPGATSCGGGGLQPPGSPTLSYETAGLKLVRLSWAAGNGGPVAAYRISAGTGPGMANMGTFDLGTLTRVEAEVPSGFPIYVRVFASNAAGQAQSREISFTLGASSVPGPPSLQAPGVAGNTVTLAWSAPSSGAAPSSYTLIARGAPGGPPIATLPGLTGTGLSIPGVPAGTYLVTIAGVNAAGMGAESAAVTVVVR